MPAGWLVERVSGRAGDLHAAAPAALDAVPVRRTVRLVQAQERAVVLGSAQPSAHVDEAAARAAGVEVARRRSGGSAVVVGPGECVWIDVVVPAGDALWDPDVGRAAWWVGEVWRVAIEEVTGRDDLAVWRGGLRRSPWSDRVCFAGVGPGEVTLRRPRGADAASDGGGDPGCKVVGVSQRRTRRGSLFQSAALLHWDPGEVVALLRGDASWRAAATAGLEDAAAGLGRQLSEPLGDAFVRHLHHLAP